ncbi:hypothetical protein ABZY20_18410 [Streptomyces sp. NPDC006624]|uniref:hypothetical protein n=1 Tax=Streptomyces sp. NPDC006624 TaxID=3154892 RepID=UPI0033A22182
MDLETLRDANFKLLDDAVTDWSTLVKHLETLKKDAEEELHQAANKADWAGVNAQVSKEFIGKTAGEFSDAHTQATTIHKILADTRTELKGYHQELVNAIDGGRKNNLTVIGYEGGFTVTTNVPPEGRAAQDKDNQSEITALRDQLQKILDKATESDNSAKTVLTAIADQSRLGFSDASYKDRDSAAEAVKQADELAKLARKDPRDLSTEEFDRLLNGLDKYGNDDLFAERFATTLGPQKTLEFWTGVNDPHRGNYELGQERLDKFDDLQRSLGTTLANATQSDSVAMTDWKRTMVDVGDKPIYGNNGGPMGFQVMSNLMRTGDYDDQFLKDYGNKLMATERKLTGNGEHANPAWVRGMSAGPLLNRIGDDSGNDPLTGYLKGLSNSPDAATDFFNQEFVNKDDKDNPFERDTDGNGKNGKVSLSNFQYLFEEREWPEETDSKGEDLHTGKNNLALALEAATTGHPAGEIPTPDTPAHNEEQTKLFESIVASISDDSTRLTEHGYMSDSMGQITREYLPDINRAMTDVEMNETSEATRDQRERIQNLFPISGSDAQMNHRDVSRFLMAVGQNPEGFAAIETGQKTYMANLMDHHLNPSLPESKRYSSDLGLTVREIAHGSGEVSGSLAVGRMEAVAGPAEEDDKAYEHRMAQWKNGISGFVGTGIGVGTSFIATPVGGAVVGGLAGTASSLVMEQLFKDAEGRAKEEAGPKMGERWENGQDLNIRYTILAAEQAAKAHHLPDTGTIGEYARTGARDGYLHAGTYLDQVAPELRTDI